MPKNTTDNGHTQPFEGFGSPNYTPVPDVVFDQLAYQLTDIEFRVLLYIVRRSFGFKKTADNISLKQLVEGIRGKDGQVLDRGAAVSKPSAVKAVHGLVEKGIIVATRNRSAEKGDEPTTYTLRFKQDPVSTPFTRGGSQPGLQGGVNGVDPQYTVIQKTDNISKLRKADTKKSDPQRMDTDTTPPAKSSVIDQSVSHQSAPTGESTDPTTAAVVPNDPPTSSDTGIPPSPARTCGLSDSVASQATSQGATATGGAGFERLREQAMRIRAEVTKRSQESQPRPLGHAPSGTTSVVPIAALLPVQKGRPPGTPDGRGRASRAEEQQHENGRQPDPVSLPERTAARPRRRLTAEERELRELYRPLLTDLARELHDDASLASSLGRFVNDFLAGRERCPDLTPEAMFSLAYEVKSRTQYWSGTITTPSRNQAGLALGTKNKMPYFFELLEIRLGLKRDHKEREARPGNPSGGDRTETGHEDKTDPAGQGSVLPSSVLRSMP